MKIVYIHGSGATSESFNRIKEHIDLPNVLIDYNNHNGFEANLATMVDILSKDKNPLFFIGHSLGGIYGLYLACNHFPQRSVAGLGISTPYGGSRHANYVKYLLPNNPLLNDINTNSNVIKGIADLDITMPWANIVTTAGANPLILEPNDGIVTVDSMRSKEGMDLIELPLNHFEVLLSNRTIDVIRQRISLIN